MPVFEPESVLKNTFSIMVFALILTPDVHLNIGP